jgi:hypothetical protein
MLQSQVQSIETAKAALLVPLAVYSQKEEDGLDAGRARHGANANNDTGTVQTQAKRELDDVNAMNYTLPTIQADFQTLEADYAHVLDYAAIGDFRTTIDQYNQMLGFRVNHWWRAIQDISDAVKSGAPFTDEDEVERNYDESSDDATRASTLFNEIGSKRAALDAEIQARINQAQTNLAAIH